MSASHLRQAPPLGRLQRAPLHVNLRLPENGRLQLVQQNPAESALPCRQQRAAGEVSRT